MISPGCCVDAGTPPTHLVVEEEDLEQYFLRLVGMNGGRKMAEISATL
jgi:hypothetical protein